MDQSSANGNQLGGRGLSVLLKITMPDRTVTILANPCNKTNPVK